MRLRLPIKFKLSSPDFFLKLEFIERKYLIEKLRLKNLKNLVEEYYFGEARLEDFPKEIEKRMSVSLFTAQEIARHIKSEIIDWDPWAEYVARLPKITVREMIEKRPKLADIEITAGYIELKGSEDLEDPTIKNWVRDYVAHLGYERHSQMQRTQYLFHSENGRNLNSPDREKLGIILKSFDENAALPVDEENREIIFESVISDQRTVNNNQMPTAVPKSQPTPVKQTSFVKPYASEPRPRPIPPIIQPEEFVQPNMVTQPSRKIIPPPYISREIDKYFNIPESPDIPPIKIHSITEHNEPKIPPPPASLREQARLRSVAGGPASSQDKDKQDQKERNRPQHRIINPFEPRIVEPRLDGNIVDLSRE